MSKTIVVVGVIAVAVGAVLLWAATRPDSFRIERSIHIKASPDKVHALINNFDAWANWSPWEKKDPAMKRTRSGPPQGVGSVYAWDGNNKVGQGRMEIAESSAPRLVRIKLDFIAPFAASNTAEFTLTPQGDGTQVTWVMYGPSPYLSKLMSLVFSMDKIVGPDFEAGLASLKALAEKP